MATSSSNPDVGLVMEADSPTDLFGDNERRARIRYRRLARSVHPDMGGSAEAMARLNALWDEYLGRAHAPKSGKVPTEVTRNETYAVFSEGDRLLVVERTTSVELALSNLGDDLCELLEGTPVCMLDCVESRLISQVDGPHGAYSCNAPASVTEGHGMVMLGSLGDRLPSGVLHPADFAWVTKRVLFLSGTLHRCGLRLDSARCLAIAADTHMLVVVAPWEIAESDDITRTLVSTYWRDIKAVVGTDERSRRIEKFILGTVCDKVTGWGDLMREFDDLLYELFGPPKFHVMEVK